MKYNFKNNFLINNFKNLLKYGKIRSNYYKLKKIQKIIMKKIKKKFFFYLIKIKIQKGDNSILGELGIFKNIYKKYLIL